MELLSTLFLILVLGVAQLRLLNAGRASLLLLVSNGTELVVLIYSENSGKRAFSELCESIVLVTMLVILLMVLVIIFDILLVMGVIICDILIVMVLWLSLMEVTVLDARDIMDK